MEKSKPVAELRRWKACLYRKYFIGDVYGHPLFLDGTRIRTSRILWRNKEEGWAETLNTVYMLGDKLEEAPESK